MTELAIKVLLKYDGSGVVGQVQATKAEIEGLKAAANDSGEAIGRAGASAAALTGLTGKAGSAAAAMSAFAASAQRADTVSVGFTSSSAQAGQQMEALARGMLGASAASDVLERQLEDLRVKLLAAGAAQENLAADFIASQVTIDALTARLRKLEGSQGSAENAGKKATQSAAAQRAAYTQLGFQIQDITSTLALGINPLVVLAQQGGQTASAVAAMGGRFATVASFIAGPWGSIILAATAVLGNLAVGLLNSGDAADEASRRQEAFGRYLDATTGKVREQISALAKLAAIQAAQKGATENAEQIAVDRRRLGRVIQQNTSPQFEATDAGVVRYDPVASSGGIATVNRLYDQYKARLIDIGTLVTKINTAAASDRTLRPLAKEVEEAGKAVSSTNDKLRDYNLTVARAAVASGSATAQQRAFVASNTQMSGSQTKLIESQVALATATSDLERARARYRIVQEGAAKADAQGGTALAKYREDLTAAAEAVNSAEAAEKAAREGKRASARATREAAKEIRDAARENRELEASFDRLARRLDPSTYALREYAKALREISALQAAGKIDQGQSILLDMEAGNDLRKAQLTAASDAMKAAIGDVDVFDELHRLMEEQFEIPRDAMRAAADELRDRGLEAIQTLSGAIENLLGGSLGRLAGGFLSSLGGAGRQGGILGLLGGQQTGAPLIDPKIFNAGLEEVFLPIRTSFTAAIKKLTDSLSGIFGQDGSLSQTLGRLAGYGALGAGVAQLTGGSKLGGTIGGVLGGAAGDALKATATKALGQTLGGLAGPLGSIAGSILGSSLGGLFGKTKSGSVNLTSATGAFSATGNSSSAKAAATGVAGSVQAGIQQIADQLGGSVGSFNVTVGQRHGDYRVTTGSSLKKKKGATDFNDDAAGATAYAIQLAVQQGAVTGLSAAVQQAIRSDTDINKALQEALKVDAVEQQLAGFNTAIRKAFLDFERQAKDRVRIATKYGFDVVKIEEQNAKDRAKILEDAVSDAVGSLKSVLEDLLNGERSAGTPIERRAKLLAQVAELQPQAATDSDAADKLATVLDQLYQVSLDAFGTAGAQFASDRATIETVAEKVISAASAQLLEAQNAARDTAGTAAAATTAGFATANSLLDEANGQSAEMIALLKQIAAATGTSADGYDAAAVARAIGGNIF